MLVAYLAQLAVLPLVNLWEETAVMGVMQARLTASRGPVVAAVVTGLVFGLYHLPLQLGLPVGDIVVSMAVILVVAVLMRFVAGWLYAGTGGSILLVAGPARHVQRGERQRAAARRHGHRWSRCGRWGCSRRRSVALTVALGRHRV
jgi:hypothetical protein